MDTYIVNFLRDKTSIHYVCAIGHVEYAKNLIAFGADVNFRNSKGQTPLHFATIHRLQRIKAVIEILIENGADVNSQDSKGYSALHAVVDAFYLRDILHSSTESLDVSIVEILLKHGAYTNVQNKRQETPLMSAAKSGNLEIVKKLLEFGANVHIRNENLETCLHVASGSDRPCNGILEELVMHGACVNCLDRQGKTALEALLQSDKPDKLKNAEILIKMAALFKWSCGIDFDIDEKFDTLHEYCRLCFDEIFQMETIIFSENFTLCHFALRGYNAKLCHLTEKDTFSAVWTSLLNGKFSIYHKIIGTHFNTLYLCKKLSTHFYIRNEKRKIIFLNEDVLQQLSFYLSDEEFFNLAVAYANSNPSTEKGN